MADPSQEFSKLLEIMKTLRSPGGCPWDLEQTLDSLKRYVVEETYEVLDAIDRRDWKGLAEELGDLQLQIVFQSQIAMDDDLFDIADVLDCINRKLIRRHPHVFDKESITTADAVKKRWDELKAEEKPELADQGLLDSVASNQPAMLEATSISKKASAAGYEWQTFNEVCKKLEEELEETRESRQSGTQEQLEDEIGDLLFTAVNIARYAGIEPEIALKRANLKFRKRFQNVEQLLDTQKKAVRDATPEELDQLWQLAKQM